MKKIKSCHSSWKVVLFFPGITHVNFCIEPPLFKINVSPSDFDFLHSAGLHRFRSKPLRVSQVCIRDGGQPCLSLVAQVCVPCYSSSRFHDDVESRGCVKVSLIPMGCSDLACIRQRSARARWVPGKWPSNLSSPLLCWPVCPFSTVP